MRLSNIDGNNRCLSWPREERLRLVLVLVRYRLWLGIGIRKVKINLFLGQLLGVGWVRVDEPDS